MIVGSNPFYVAKLRFPSRWPLSHFLWRSPLAAQTQNHGPFLWRLCHRRWGVTYLRCCGGVRMLQLASPRWQRQPKTVQCDEGELGQSPASYRKRGLLETLEGHPLDMWGASVEVPGPLKVRGSTMPPWWPDASPCCPCQESPNWRLVVLARWLRPHTVGPTLNPPNVLAISLTRVFTGFGANPQLLGGGNHAP